MYDPFLAGCISGIFQTIAGHPLDTLKTWKQNEGLLKIPSRNFLNLYKGISMPLLQLPIICSVTFGVDNYTHMQYLFGLDIHESSGVRLATRIQQWEEMASLWMERTTSTYNIFFILRFQLSVKPLI